MKIKLGCKYQTEYDLKGVTISRTNHFDCVFLDFPVPQNSDDIHSLNCPICNEPIKINITGKQTATLQRKVYLILAIIIFLPFCFWLYHYVFNQGFNILGIFLILFLGFFFSSFLFLKVLANDFYKSASIVGSGKHKIINK